MKFRIMTVVFSTLLILQFTTNISELNVLAQCDNPEEAVIDIDTIDQLEALVETNLIDIAESNLGIITTSLTTSPGGRWFGIRTNRGSWIIDIENEFEISNIPFTNNSNILFISDSRVISLTPDGFLQEWDIDEQEFSENYLIEVQSEILASTINTDGELFATLTEDQLSIWNSDDFSLSHSYAIDFLEASQFNIFLYFLPNGEYLLLDTPGSSVYLFEVENDSHPIEINLPGRVFPSTYDNSLFVYDPTSENPLVRLSVSDLLDTQDINYEVVYDSEINLITAVNPISGIFSVTNGDGQLTLVNQDGGILRALDAHDENVTLSVFDISGRYLVTIDSSRESKLVIWGLPECGN